MVLNDRLRDGNCCQKVTAVNKVKMMLQAKTKQKQYQRPSSTLSSFRGAKEEYHQNVVMGQC